MTSKVNGIENDEERLKLLGALGANQLKGGYAESLARLKNFVKNSANEAVDQISLLIEASLSLASAATSKIASCSDAFKLGQLEKAAGKLSDSVLGGAPSAAIESNISDFGKALSAINVEEITKDIASGQRVAKTDDPASSSFQPKNPHKNNIDLNT